MSGIMLMMVGGKGGDAPANTVAPALSDSTPVYNQTISTTTGTWTSITTPSFAYQWQRNSGNISGATSSSYTITSTDVGTTVRCVVTATNPFGSDAANSNTSSTVAAIAPNAPTIGTATGGEEQASIAFTNLSFPTQTGGATITSYQAISTPGSVTGTASGTPITVTGLTGGTAYTFKVRAANSVGYGSYSGNSNSITPTSPSLGLVTTNKTGNNVASDMIQRINIATTGNATDFGNLLAATYQSCMGASSTTRSVVASGYTSALTNVMQYSTFSTSGNATDFGDVTVKRIGGAGGGNATSGLFAGGQDQYSTNRIDKITIASTGNSTNFGALQDQYVGAEMGMRFLAGTSSPTYSFWWGGQSGWDGSVNYDIQRTTISSGGTTTYTGVSGGSGNIYSTGMGSSTRGVCSYGSSNSENSFINYVGYITHTTTGNAASFGQLTQKRLMSAGVSSTTRGIIAGGKFSTSDPRGSNVMDYCTISTTGNFTDFGDLVETVYQSYTGTSSDGGGQQ